MVLAGPKSAQPLVVLESGAFGCAADWSVVQARLAGFGVRSLAYDRAGLGFSDPGPKPRDGQAIASDLESLLAKLKEQGPLILVGHSMAGQLLRVFVPRNAARVVGLVLVDAVTPEAMTDPRMGQGVRLFRRGLGFVKVLASLGLMKLLSGPLGDSIGLDPEAAREKRHIFGLTSHAEGAALEVEAWEQTSDQGIRHGLFDPALPVAVVTAGAPGRAEVKALQEAPARQADRGYITHIAGAGHATLLGTAFADAILQALVQVMSPDPTLH